MVTKHRKKHDGNNAAAGCLGHPDSFRSGRATQLTAAEPPKHFSKRPLIAIRGVYGGVPREIFERGESLDEYGINAIWIGSGSVTRELVGELTGAIEASADLRRIQHDARRELLEGPS